MRYLVTDAENKTWRGEIWGEGVSHREPNSNYFFWTYTHPDVAALMIPIERENLQMPKLWSCEVADLDDVDYGTVSHDWGYKRRYPWVKTFLEEACFVPSPEQRIAFAMLCTMSLTKNPLVLAWMRNWLLDIDRSPDTAEKVSDVLTDEMWQQYHSQREYYTHSAYGLTCAVAQPEKTALYAAGAAYRAYIDSLRCPECGDITRQELCTNPHCAYSTPYAKGYCFEVVDLEKNAEIIKFCSIQEIASIIC